MCITYYMWDIIDKLNNLIIIPLVICNRWYRDTHLFKDQTPGQLLKGNKKACY